MTSNLIERLRMQTTVSYFLAGKLISNREVFSLMAVLVGAVSVVVAIGGEIHSRQRANGAVICWGRDSGRIQELGLAMQPPKSATL